MFIHGARNVMFTTNTVVAKTNWVEVLIKTEQGGVIELTFFIGLSENAYDFLDKVAELVKKCDNSRITTGHANKRRCAAVSMHTSSSFEVEARENGLHIRNPDNALSSVTIWFD